MSVPSRRAVELLRTPLDASSTLRLWHELNGRRERSMARTWQTSMRWALAGGALAAALVLGVQHLPSRSFAAGPLLLRDGAPIGEIRVSAADPLRAVEFSDGSTMQVHPNSAVVPLVNTAQNVSFVVQNGETTVDVRPNGPRKWSLVCGPVTVDVVGTRFSLTCTAAAATVWVDRGAVQVRGEAVPGRQKRLGAGEQLCVGDETLLRGADATNSPAVAPPGSSPVQSAASKSSGLVSASPAEAVSADWRSMASRGEYGRAYATLGPSGVQREAEGAEVTDLLTLADVARLSGHPQEAARVLALIVEKHPQDPRASLAAFSLGRMGMGPQGTPGQAAGAFSRALALGLPAGLREEAWLRLIESRQNAGDVTGARAAAQQYREQYPHGRYLDTIREWSSSNASDGAAGSNAGGTWTGADGD
jgi:transmembrane sensor